MRVTFLNGIRMSRNEVFSCFNLGSWVLKIKFSSDPSPKKLQYKRCIVKTKRNKWIFNIWNNRKIPFVYMEGREELSTNTSEGAQRKTQQHSWGAPLMKASSLMTAPPPHEGPLPSPGSRIQIYSGSPLERWPLWLWMRTGPCISRSRPLSF